MMKLFYFYPLMELFTYILFIAVFGFSAALLYGLISFIVGMSLLNKNNAASFSQKFYAIDIKSGTLSQLAGFLLVIPGFFTNTIGFSIWFYTFFQKRPQIFRKKSKRTSQKASETGQVIDGEYEVLKDHEQPPRDK
jgi:UPF0716 family protein affecting phage T7 exclusion